MTAQKSWRRRVTSVFATATAGLLAVSGAVLAPTAAYAAEVPVSNAEMTWGVKESWRVYISGPMSAGSVTAEAPATGTDEGIITFNDGVSSDLDVDVPKGMIAYQGAVHFQGHGGYETPSGYGLNQRLSDPQISITGAGTATVSVYVEQDPFKVSPQMEFPEVDERVDFALITFDQAAFAADRSVTSTSAVLTERGSWVYGGYYAEGAVVDPITFTAPAAPVITTTTTLDPLPSEVLTGETVDLSATVAPAEAAGTVTFKSNGTAIEGATDLPVVDGSAGVEDIVLPLGTNSIVAEFAPANAAAYAASVSAARSVQVNVVPAVDTATEISAIEGPILLGEEATISASVVADNAEVPTGSVEFFSLASSEEPRVSIGTDTLDTDGNASITTSDLAAGGYSFVAVFTPEDPAAFNSSEQTTPIGGREGYYLSVVDPAAPAAYEPGAYAQTTEGATASWGWSVYSGDWTKIADGENITLAEDGETFEFSNGTAVTDANGAVVSFTGSFRTQAYEAFFGPDGQWIEFIDPALHLNADGTGVWVAGVNTGIRNYVANEDAPRLVIGVVDGTEGGGFGTDGERTATFAYADTTAAGTWSAARTAAWPNAFVLQVPSAIRSFYYATGAGGDANKPASDLLVDFEWPSATATELFVAPANLAELGEEVVLSAEIEPAVPGTVEFFSTSDVTGTESKIGEADVIDGIAEISTTELAAGGHLFRAEFTSADGYIGSEKVAEKNYGVVDTAAPAAYEPGAGAQTTEGATASWGWSAYSGDWTKIADGVNITLAEDGETFEFSNGTAVTDANGAVVSFTGSFRAQAYEAFFGPDGQWIEFIDPALHLNADGTGVWVAGVNTGIRNYVAKEDAPRLVIGVVDGTEGGGFGTDGERTATFAYEETTASGTWKAGYDSAWPNAFVLQVPSAIQAFYYASGTGGDANKPASDLLVDFEWPSATETELFVAPAAPVELGSDVTLTAEVEPAAVAEGTVEFFATSAVTGTESKIGEADVVDGVAEISTTELAAGGHTFRAAFTSSNAYTDSDTVTTANYGVVDTGAAPACVPAEGSAAFDGVSANWGWSAYAANWPKEVTAGNGTVEEGVFVLTDGVAIVGEDCTQISFDATLLVDPYRTYSIPDTSKPLIELSYPVLTIDAEGNGVWSADVRSGIGGLEGEAVERVIATITGADALDFTQDVISTDVEFDFVDTTALGTWSAGKTDAWSNGFILSLPSSVRAFFYASGSGSDATKTPAAIGIDWAWDPAEPSAFVNGQEAAEVEPGETVTFTAGPFLERGSDVAVEVHSDPISLGNVTADPLTGVAEISWTIPADFEVGSTHSVIFTQGDVSATAIFTVVAAPSGGDGGSGGGSDAAGGAGTAVGTDSKGLASTGVNGMEGMIALGALALLIGAASILVARRRATSQQ